LQNKGLQLPLKKTMIMKHLSGIFFLIATVGCAQTHTLHKSEDLTKENLFSTNIEGPSFDKQGNLYVVNFQKDGTIGFVKPNGDVELFLTLPEGSTGNSIQFDSKGDMYLADFSGHNVLKVAMKTKEISVYAHDNFNQPNDICINRKDQIFASDPNWKESSGKIWRVDVGGKAVLLNDQMGTTNGIELSPDEKTLYVNESIQRKVWAFDVDDKGDISNKRLFAEFSDYGFDGMKCDKQGNLYIARYGKGTIVVISQQGKQIREIPLKGKSCSNLVFGGKDGKEVVVTLQDRKGMEKFYNDIPGKKY
jgi:gluconolactonase